MKYVEDYYTIYQYQNPNVNFTRRIYLATDEPKVYLEAYVQYENFIFSTQIISMCIYT